MRHLLGIDIGTTGAKTVLFTEHGTSVATAFSPWPMSMPQPAWAEQDPEDWWTGTVASIREVLAASVVDPASITGIGLSGQMHGLVLLDAKQEVLRPSIIWCDQRTGEECAWIDRTIGTDRLVAAISNPVLPGFTAPKLVWVRSHEPDIWERARTILLPKDYVRLRLTGEIAIELSDAAGTALFNVAERRWADDLLGDLGIPRAWLPAVCGSTDVVGGITRSVAEATGLREGTPVVGGGADNACAAVGNGVIHQGLGMVSIGSSGVVLAPSREPRVDSGLRVHTFNHSVPDLWYLMGVTQGAGLSLRWFRDEFGDTERTRAMLEGRDAYDLMADEAAVSPPGSKGVIWLPYMQGERTPHFDPAARAVLFGLSTAHTKADVFRAVLEGVACSLRDCLSIVREQGVTIEQVRLTGGGARSRLWRQIVADVMGVELVITSTDEGPALGAALLAAVGTGIYGTIDEACAATIAIDETVEPIPDHMALYDRTYEVYRDLYPALKASYAKSTRLADAFSSASATGLAEAPLGG